MNQRTWGLISLALFAASPLPAETPTAQNNALKKVSFVQNLNGQIPLDLPFRNEKGQPVKLADYIQDKPVILSLVYYECPMLCTESLNGLLRAVRSIKFDAGREYNILTVSFDPMETPELAAGKRDRYVERYGRPVGDRGWAFLVGNQAAIQSLTDTAGFHYAYDAEAKQYAHATGLVILTPSGKISHYLFGVEYSARDLKLALVEASAGQIGSPVDQLLLYCYHYDPLTGKYSLAIMNVLRVAGGAMVLILAGGILFFLRREKRAATA